MDVLSPAQKKKGFPKWCCVPGCRTKSDYGNKTKRRLFRFVPRFRPQMGQSRKNMVNKRFYMWIDILGIDPRNAKYLWVCCRHFVKGRPARQAQYWNVDWVPNQNLHNESGTNDDLADSLNRLFHDDFTYLSPQTSINIEAQTPRDEVCDPSQDPDLEGPFCRFCFTKNVNMRPLFPSPRVDENHLIRVVEEVACIRLQFSDDYNSFICHECQQNMETFFGYRKMWQANDLMLRAFRGKDSVAEPIPIVQIPIERLMEDPSDNTDPFEALAFSKENCSLDEQKPDINEHQNNQEDRCSDQNVPIDLADTKLPLAEISGLETTFVCDNSLTVPGVQNEPQEGSEVKFTGQNEKDRLIRKLMRKVRRETLSPKKDDPSYSKKHNSTKRIRGSKNRIDIEHMVSNKIED